MNCHMRNKYKHKWKVSKPNDQNLNNVSGIHLCFENNLEVYHAPVTGVMRSIKLLSILKTV